MSDFTDGHACKQIFMDVVVVRHEDSLHNQCGITFAQQCNCRNALGCIYNKIGSCIYISWLQT